MINPLNSWFSTNALIPEHFSTKLVWGMAGWGIYVYHAYVYHIHTQDGYSPLYCASQEGHDEVVEMLLHAGAKVDLWT